MEPDVRGTMVANMREPGPLFLFPRRLSGWSIVIAFGLTTVASYGTIQYLFTVLEVPLATTFAWLDIPLVTGNIASDQRQFTREGFSAVGLSVGAAKLHTPDDTIELVQPEALDIAARLLLATISSVAS